MTTFDYSVIFIGFGICGIVVFGVVCYLAGRRAAEEDHRRAEARRIKALRAAGYDPTPFYEPEENICEDTD